MIIEKLGRWESCDQETAMINREYEAETKCDIEALGDDRTFWLSAF